MNLPKLIQSSDGFTLTRVMREDDLAIYRRRKAIGKAVIEHFEVVMVIPGEPGSGYPESEAWGMRGWTCRTIEAAWERVGRIRADLGNLPAAGKSVMTCLDASSDHGRGEVTRLNRLVEERAWLDD